MRFNKQKSGCGILGANRVVEASGLLAANAVIDSPCENTTTTSTTTCGLPAVPSGFNIADAVEDYILLGFGLVSGATLYEIWRSVDGGESELHFVTTSSNFADFGIVDFSEYCYKVRAMNSCGYSEFTEELCSTNGVTSTTSSTSTTSTTSTSTSTTSTTTSTTSTSTSTTSTTTESTTTTTTTCGIPVAPDAPLVADGALAVEGFCAKLVSWEIPSGATSIKLRISRNGEPFGLVVFSGGETSYELAVSCGYEWCFEVQACNDCGCSEFSGFGDSCSICSCPTTTTSTTTVSQDCLDGILSWINSPPEISESLFWDRDAHYIACLGIDPAVVTEYTSDLGHCYEITPFPEDGPNSYTMTRVECPTTTSTTTEA